MDSRLEWPRHIETAADSQVGTPLARERIRNSETGFLAICSEDYCSWQGFSRVGAGDTGRQNHVDRARRSSGYEYHYGEQYAFMVELIDDMTVWFCPDQRLDPLKPRHAQRDGQRLIRHRLIGCHLTRVFIGATSWSVTGQTTEWCSRFRRRVVLASQRLASSSLIRTLNPIRAEAIQAQRIDF